MFPTIVNALFKYEIDDEIFPSNKILNFTLWILLLPLELLSAMAIIYIDIPYASLKGGIKRAWNGSVDETEVLGFAMDIDTDNLPMVKVFEYLGEACPQLVLAVVFAIHNYPFLVDHDTYFGIQIPVTIVSIVFSLGSLIIGLVSGLPGFYEAAC